MTPELPSFLEDHISQIPALQLLQNLVWRYLTPGEAVALRGRKLDNVLLESVLVEQLHKLNRIRFKALLTPMVRLNEDRLLRIENVGQS